MLAGMDGSFHGAKAAVFIGEQLLLYRRDTDVHWGGMWDMPGGGREGYEPPKDCLSRELFEEFALDARDAIEEWRAEFSSMDGTGKRAWFFVLRFPASYAEKIRFGNEGQYWRLFQLDEAIDLPDLIAPLRDRLNHWLRQVGNTKA